MQYGDRLKRLRESMGLSQKELTDRLSLNRSTYARYETSSTQPDFDTLKKLADFFGVTTDYILGRTQSNLPKLTYKEEKDIVKDLEKVMEGLEGGYSAYDGKTPEELEDIELLKKSLETSMTLAKRIAKKKFNPNKKRSNKGD